MIMVEWKEYKLGEVASLSTGFPFKGEKYSKEGVRVVRGDNVTIGELRWPEEKDKRWNEPFDRSEEFSLRENDIVIGMDGSRVGYNRAQIKKEDLPLLIAQRVACIRNNEKSLQSFLYYQIFSNRFLSYIRNIQTGSAIPHVSLKQIGDFTISLPSLDIQRNIASILSSLDDKIAVNKKICENLEAQAQALFKHWFVDFAPFKDGKFVESELGLIPERWRVGTLGDICVTNKRTYGSSSLGIIEYIDTGSVTNNKIDNIQVLDPKIDKIPSRARRAITEGDILFSSVRPNQRHFAYMYNPNSRMVASTGFIVITANWSGYRYYIYQYLIQDSVINYLQAIAEQSVSTYPSINASDITNIKVIIPPDDIIGNYAAILSRFMGEIDRNNQESSRLASLRDTLLPKLMSGQIKLSEYE